MTLIKWQENFSVGVESVDHEHQELIALINELHDAMMKETSITQVVESLGEIYANIAAHFALEEKIMRSMHYRAYAEHKEDHEVLLDDLLEIMDEVEADQQYDPHTLSTDLNRWFSDHFRTHDAKLHGLGYDTEIATD